MTERPTESWRGDRWELRRGDSLWLIRDVPDGSVDAVVTDPPYSSGGIVRYGSGICGV